MTTSAFCLENRVLSTSLKTRKNNKDDLNPVCLSDYYRQIRSCPMTLLACREDHFKSLSILEAHKQELRVLDRMLKAGLEWLILHDDYWHKNLRVS